MLTGIIGFVLGFVFGLFLFALAYERITEDVAAKGKVQIGNKIYRLTEIK